MSEVFISYARSTAGEARRVAEALRGQGYGVWRDDDLPAHRDYAEVIEERLRAARAVVVLWSAEAVRSQWVRAEADVARQAGVLVQLTLDGAPLPLPFNRIQCADLCGWTGEATHPGWLKVAASVAELVGAPGGESAAGPARAPAPGPATAPTPPQPLAVGNLPRRHGALIGRRGELAQIEALVESADLVTVTGAGGVGKTRLALEFAHAAQARCEDGAWLVELAPLTEPDQVVGAVARALGFELPADRDPLDALIERLRPRQCLIVLDNCEHVIDAVAVLAEAVTERAGRVKLLASSQEPIGVEGERVFRLRSLAEADAAALFVERARAADAAFAPKARDEAAIAAICQRLDGIPLAVEMAAARAPALGCEGVLTRLDDRFRLLTGGRRTALPRQRTLQATLDWSFGLLSADDAAVFRRLGVFTGGFTLEAAGQVAASGALDALRVIDAVASLLAKSLVVADAAEEGPGRYRLLETTRMYALEQLAEAGETGELQRRHAECFAEATADWPQDYQTLPDEVLHARWAPEMANVEKAIDWAYGPDGDEALGVAILSRSYAAWATLWRFQQFVALAQRAVAHLAPDAERSDVLRLKAGLLNALAIASPRAAAAFAEEILPDLRADGDPVRLGDALYSATMAYGFLARDDLVAPLVDEFEHAVAALPTCRVALGFQYAQAIRCSLRADPAGVRARLAGGVERARSIGAQGWANLMRLLPIEARGAEPTSAAENARRINEARDLLASVRPVHMFSNYVIPAATYQLVSALGRRAEPGDIDEAYALVRGLEKMVGRVVPPQWHVLLATLAIGDGRPADGARLMGHGAEEARRRGIDHSRVGHVLADLRAALLPHLTDAEIQSLAAEGARMTFDQAYDLALNLR